MEPRTATIHPMEKPIAVTLTREQWEKVMEALSDLSNQRLRDAGSFLDSGDDEEALDCHKASRRLHLLHKEIDTTVNRSFGLPTL